MIVSQQVQQNFSRASGRYDAHAILQQQWRMRVLAHGLALFADDAHLLDIGCGTGAFTASAREIQPRWQVLGLDMAAGMCRVAVQHGRVLQADGAALPLRDGSVQGVVSSLCLQWVGDSALALREIARVLVPGAHAIVMTLGEATLQELRVLAPSLRLLPMRSVETYRMQAQEAGFLVTAMDAPVERYRYASLSGLLRSFRAIGANAAFQTPPQRLRPSEYHAIAQAYHARHATADGGIYASWQPVLMVLQKPEVR